MATRPACITREPPGSSPAPMNWPYRITVLQEVDIEHCFWAHGYQDVFRRAAFPSDSTRKGSAKVVISRAIDRRSKPYLAALLVDAAIDRGPEGVPLPLRRVIERCIRLARKGKGKEPSRMRPDAPSAFAREKKSSPPTCCISIRVRLAVHGGPRSAQRGTRYGNRHTGLLHALLQSSGQAR